VKNGILHTINAKIEHFKAKTIELYLTGYGWQTITVKNGIISHKLNLPLKRSRNRLLLKYGNQQSTQLIMREN
jgi:hypothetical protein